MDFGDQRAGGVKDFQATLSGFLMDTLGDAMGAEDHRGVIGDFGQLLDEHRSLLSQPIHNILIVHDLMAHIDRRFEQFQRSFHNSNGAVHTGAKTARIGKSDLHVTVPQPVAADAGLLLRRESTSQTAAPTVMAESARLNAGHDHCR